MLVPKTLKTFRGVCHLSRSSLYAICSAMQLGSVLIFSDSTTSVSSLGSNDLHHITYLRGWSNVVEVVINLNCVVFSPAYVYVERSEHNAVELFPLPGSSF